MPEISHVERRSGGIDPLIIQINDRLDIISNSLIKVENKEAANEQNIGVETKRNHPLKGKTSLSFRSSFLNLGSVVNISTLPNDTIYRNASNNIPYYKDHTGASIELLGGGGGGITDHTLLSNIGTNTHAEVDTHLADSTKHFLQSAISIPASQISDFDTEVSNNTSVVANTAKISFDSASSTRLADTSGTNTGDQDLSSFVSKVGTPVDNQIGIWTGDGTIEGSTGLTYDGSKLILGGGANVLQVPNGSWISDVTANGTGSLYLLNDTTPGLSNGGSSIYLSGASCVSRGDGGDSILLLSSGTTFFRKYNGVGDDAGVDLDSTYSKLFFGTNTLQMDATKLTSNVRVEGLDPTDAQDFVTKTYGETNFLDRTNHTGTQTASTISDFDTEVSNNTSVVTNNEKISFDSTSSTRLANTSGTNTGDNATNTQYSSLVSADGSVITHSDVTNAGSGAIITSTERTNFGTAYGWGDHSGLYLPLHGKADDSSFLNGVAESTSASNSTIVKRTSNGQIFGTYLNMTGTFANSHSGQTMAYFTGSNGSDNYGRAYSPTSARVLLNVEDGANNYVLPSDVVVDADIENKQNTLIGLSDPTSISFTAGNWYTVAEIVVGSTGPVDIELTHNDSVYGRNYARVVGDVGVYSLGGGSLSLVSDTSVTISNFFSEIRVTRVGTSTTSYLQIKANKTTSSYVRKLTIKFNKFSSTVPSSISFLDFRDDSGLSLISGVQVSLIDDIHTTRDYLEEVAPITPLAEANHFAFSRVGGGMFQSTASSTTGYIRVELPVGLLNERHSFEVDVFCLNTLDADQKIFFKGYTATAGYQSYGLQTVGASNNSIQAITTLEGGKACVYFGSKIWRYPVISISNVQVSRLGGTTVGDNWKDGWGISIETSVLGTPVNTYTSVPYATEDYTNATYLPLTGGTLSGDLNLEGGAIALKETTTPTADTNYGKVYTKSDNKLYFQDGGGTEHEIAFV